MATKQEVRWGVQPRTQSKLHRGRVGECRAAECGGGALGLRLTGQLTRWCNTACHPHSPPARERCSRGASRSRPAAFFLSRTSTHCTHLDVIERCLAPPLACHPPQHRQQQQQQTQRQRRRPTTAANSPPPPVWSVVKPHSLCVQGWQECGASGCELSSLHQKQSGARSSSSSTRLVPCR